MTTTAAVAAEPYQNLAATLRGSLTSQPNPWPYWGLADDNRSAPEDPANGDHQETR